MKRIVFFALVALLFAQCKPTENVNSAQFVVNGTLSGITDSLVYLQDYVDGDWKVLDSVKPVNETFEFKGDMDAPKMLYIALKSGKRKYIAFFTDNATITINAQVDSLNKAVITGSPVNTEYQGYLEGMHRFDNINDSLYQLYQIAQQNQDPSQIKKIEAEYETVYTDQQKFSKDFVWAHNTSFISPYILYRELSYDMEYNELDSFMQHFADSLSKSVYVKQIAERIEVLKSVAIGKVAPEIELPDTAGNMIKLSSFRGKYVLIDFWASWCRPCRGENPANVALYKEFKSKGFEIFGVAFDKTKEDWTEAIAQDGITWPQVSDLKYWNCAAGKTYGVRSIPHTVLLDTNGVILVKNLRGEELRAKVSSLLNKK